MYHIHKTTYFYQGIFHDPGSGIMKDEFEKPLVFDTEEQANEYIAGIEARGDVYYLQHGEYARPSYKVVPAPKDTGRPRLYNESMKRTAVRLPETMVAWLSQQPGGMAATMRRLVEAAMREKAN